MRVKKEYRIVLSSNCNGESDLVKYFYGFTSERGARAEAIRLAREFGYRRVTVTAITE